ncbi:hypothetical protein C1645_742805 [Glomus cerebriforme]|uniref:Uncharacterized protein n=1 Tax=Glomus cerebriforme TaxID=658196 RepID=A0A397SCT7_9GLOM|nr:hypothetical protein C1645_742805 [Glomus cerebriforme]
MATRNNFGLRDPLQDERRSYSFRTHWKESKGRQLSAGPDHYGLEHHEFSLGFRNRDGTERKNRISYEKSGTPGRISIENINGFKFTSFDSKYNIFNRNRGKNSTMHVRDFDALSSANEQTISKNKGTGNDDIAVGNSGYRICTNRGSIATLFSSFGQLRRVNSVGSDVQRTEFQPERCHFVHANTHYSQEQSTSGDQSTVPQMSARDSKDGVSSISNNSSILVETFENVSDRTRFASSIGYSILTDSEAEDLFDYIACVEKYGFDHIIVIGEVEFGMIFSDCYGRIFKWDDESMMLWPRGDPKNLSNMKKGEDWFGWFVKDGIVYEYIRRPLRMEFPDLFAPATKKEEKET